jgi:hypothetical protein
MTTPPSGIFAWFAEFEQFQVTRPSLGLLPPAPLSPDPLNAALVNALWPRFPLAPAPAVPRNALTGPLDDLKRALWPEFPHAPRTTLPSL